MLQAKAFSVLCKFDSVLVNTLIRQYHASMEGIFWLLVCIMGGIVYQQAMQGAPVTKPQTPPDKNSYEKVSPQRQRKDADETEAEV